MTEIDKNAEEKPDYGLQNFVEDHKDSIGRLIDVIGKRYGEEPKRKFQSTALGLGLVAVVIVVVAVLGVQGVLTDNTISFVLGSVIGYIFSFIKELIGTE